MIIDDIKTIFTGKEIEITKASKEEEDEIVEKELRNGIKRKRKTRDNPESCKETS